MAIIDVTISQLSESVAEATLLNWKKSPGDAVAVDEILFEIETDKVVFDVPSPSAGILFEILVGDVVDHPRDGVRAIDGRCPAGDHIDPLDQHLRQGADIDQAVGRGRRHAVAVEQSQSAQSAHVAQIQG